MQLLTMLATAHGRWVAADSPELLDWIGDRNPDFDPVGFVIRNLGFIQFETYGESFAQITLFPKRVAPAALAAVQERILSGVHRVFRIDQLDRETRQWQLELAMNPREAVGRLNRLCGVSVSPGAKGPYEAIPCDLGTILADETHPAHPLLRKWRGSFHQFDETVLPFMDRHGLTARRSQAARAGLPLHRRWLRALWRRLLRPQPRPESRQSARRRLRRMGLGLLCRSGEELAAAARPLHRRAQGRDASADPL
jgi:hypothetical protein